MPTLGEELKRRREERQITLNEISEATRIGIRFLKAIDADNYAVLPGGIFTRSFIRAYAKEIGMDEEEAITLYNQQTTPPAAETGVPASGQSSGGRLSSSSSSGKKTPSIIYAPEPERTRSSSMSRTPTRTNWGTIIIAAGILVIIGVVVTALVRQLNKAGQERRRRSAVLPRLRLPNRPIRILRRRLRRNLRQLPHPARTAAPRHPRSRSHLQKQSSSGWKPSATPGSGIRSMKGSRRRRY